IFKPAQTSLSDITASSQFGLSGTVVINNPDVDPTSGLVELSTDVTDPTDQVSVGCVAKSGNSFIVTGRGGLPQDPTATLRGQTVLSDRRDFTESGSDLPVVSKTQRTSMPRTITQIQSWTVNANGQVELVAHLPQESLSNRYPTC
ncbi:MAG: S-layer family protein, partial [Cyanobacteria bacterium P01_F01_bin.42]